MLSDDRPRGLLASLGKKLGYPEDKYENSVIKVVGEDAFLLDNHRIIDYEHVREKIAMGKVSEIFPHYARCFRASILLQVPNLTVMDASSVDVEQASEFVYLSLERDVNLAQMGELANGGGATAPGLRGQDSLTALSLSNVVRLNFYSGTVLGKQLFSVLERPLPVVHGKAALLGAR